MGARVFDVSSPAVMRGCTRKHKCKKKHLPTAPCDDCLSEYRNVYVRKPIGPPKSCKPDQTPMMTDAPAEDKTTTRYITVSCLTISWAIWTHCEYERWICADDRLTLTTELYSSCKMWKLDGCWPIPKVILTSQPQSKKVTVVVVAQTSFMNKKHYSNIKEWWKSVSHYFVYLRKQCMSYPNMTRSRLWCNKCMRYITRFVW